MKFILASLLMISSFSALQSQTTSDNTDISPDNAEYMEWVSQNGFTFVSEFKEGEATVDRMDIVDSEGNPIPEDVNAATFDITKYDFDTVIAPDRNVMIKITDDKAIFIRSRYRQSVLFKRHLINSKAK